MATQGTDYINTIDYKKLETKFKDLVSVMDELYAKNTAARKLRYSEIDIEAERNSGKLAPDELFIPQHIIDSNIRREQSSYVQYVVQSPRACVLQDIQDPSQDTQILERDLTTRLRFDGWQMSMFANIDGFQQNGYGIMEVVQDQTQPGELAHETVQMGDFGIVSDTRDIQESEMTCRHYYFSKTRLLGMCNEQDQFVLEQVQKVVGEEPVHQEENTGDRRDSSLYRIQKIMFRVGGIVHVAWGCQERGDDWLRLPRPLYLGRRQLGTDPATGQPIPDPQARNLPLSKEDYETEYPYVLFPYLISENATISRLKGRAYLDQDAQEAITSLLSSLCTGFRRASGFYLCKDSDDPNDDLAMQKNIFLKQGAIFNKKITQFQLSYPDSSMLSAIQALVTANQAETSQVNFAAQNRKDSRKTAAEINVAAQTQQQLSTVQVVLFSNAIKNLYTKMFLIIKSRILAGLIKVSPQLVALYQRDYVVKPSGDTDVIERQQMVQQMMQAWQVIQNTPAAPAFLSDLLTKMFPDNAPKYIQIMQQAQQQAQSAQAQQQNQLMQTAQQMGKGIIELSKHKDMFSEKGQLHALPVVEQAAQQLEQIQQQMQPQQQQKAQ